MGFVAAGAVRKFVEMKMMLKLLRLQNKKGVDYYTPFVAIVGFLVLAAVLTAVMLKQYGLASEFNLGREQLRLFHTYSTADKMLSFVDDSAKLSLEQAAHSSGSKGFYNSIPACGSKDSFNYWSKDSASSANDCVPETTPCYPDEAAVKSAFLENFEKSLSGFVKSFNDKGGFEVDKKKVELPFDYKLELQPVPDRTEVVGISGKPLVIASAATNPFKYEVKPSFRESIPIDVVAQGAEVVKGAKQLAKPNKKDAEKKLSDFSKAGALKWSLAGYSTQGHSPPCAFVVEPKGCNYKCNCQPTTDCGDSDPKTTCGGECETCYYDKVEIVTYNDITALFSADSGKKFPYYDPASKKVVMKSVAYDFGLSWIEVTGSSTNC
ncbi:hypothetical protein HYV85_03090 [Candidatus Woesearchaeota archaeon]|nr:hypothetical protein [Candidatus Woesearchaeota archaeon]